MKTEDFSYSLDGRAANRIHLNKTQDGETYHEGAVLTEFGTLTVYAQGGERYDPHSRIDFAYKGRVYVRNFMKTRLTPRGLVMLGRRFAREIVRKHK